MTSSLRGRVRRLEKAQAQREQVLVVLLRSFTGDVLERITSGATEWVRHADETADQFRARVRALPHAATAGNVCALIEHNTPPENVNHQWSPAA